MVFVNYTTMQVAAKIVYYGPGLCGKTTNLQQIHRKTAPQSRGEMISLETESDRTLFFDLLPLEAGVVAGMRVRLQLYTVPGQVFYNSTRKMVLKGVDGLVFVADSQATMMDANLESLSNLRQNLAELGLRFEDIPTVFQYNKRDLRNIDDVAELQAALNPRGLEQFEAAAVRGIGVFETLKAISRLTIEHVRRTSLGDRGRATGRSGTTAAAHVPAPAPPLAPAAPPRAPAAVAAPSPTPARDPTTAPLLALPDLPPPAAESPLAALGPPPGGAAPPPPAGDDPLAGLLAPGLVEFAEEDTGKHQLRAVPTRAMKDITAELARVRQEAAGRDDLLDALEQSLGPPRLIRSVRVDVPADLLREAAAVRVDLVFEKPGHKAEVRDAARVELEGHGGGLTLELHVDGRREP